MNKRRSAWRRRSREIRFPTRPRVGQNFDKLRLSYPARRSGELMRKMPEAKTPTAVPQMKTKTNNEKNELSNTSLYLLSIQLRSARKLQGR